MGNKNKTPFCPVTEWGALSRKEQSRSFRATDKHKAIREQTETLRGDELDSVRAKRKPRAAHRELGSSQERLLGVSIETE